MYRYVKIVLGAILILPLSNNKASSCFAKDRNNDALIELDVDPRIDNPVYFAGGPLPFALRLKLVPHISQARVSSDWYIAARIEWSPVVDKQRANKWTLFTFSTTAATASRPAKKMRILTRAKRGTSAYLVIPPKQTKRLPTGLYVLKARVTVAVVGADSAAKTVEIEDEFKFKIVPVKTPEQKARLSLMMSKYSLENERNLDAAIKYLEDGLRDSGKPKLHYRLGWLYQSKGQFKKAIAASRAYIAWARASGIPRRRTGRGPQEIADELERRIIILEKRIENKRGKEKKTVDRGTPHLFVSSFQLSAAFVGAERAVERFFQRCQEIAATERASRPKK